MIKRRKTNTVQAGRVKLGAGHPIAIQTMTKTATTNISSCLRQIKRLHKEKADLVRIAVPTREDTRALAEIIKESPLPIIADVHFSAARAIESIEAGAVKIRINPGNIKDPNDITRIIDAAKANNTAIRAGINEASIRDLKQGDVAPDKRVSLMLKEMKKYVKLFDARGFTNLVLSAKSADILRTIEINRSIAKTFHCPIHLGLTHAGLAEDAAIPSAVALGVLLHEGIGDTVRVSIAGNPNQEIKIARQILKALGLYHDQEPKLIVCPTCGRCQIDVVKLAKSVRKVMKDVKIPVKLAVMGCIVNGPGEAKDADLAICAANKKGYLYRNGVKLATVPEENLLEAMAEELDKMGAFENQRQES